MPPSPRNARLILRVAGWNLLFILIGLLLIGIAGETYFRMIGRFGNVISDLSTDSAYWRFEPGVGLLRPPHMELTLSNSMDSWTVQRANSLGFLDREPIDPARAEESCHISIIGDSFVEGREVPLSDKLQVRLEGIAAHEAPHLDVTTSAFGIQRTGQMNQLPFYDRYAKRMSPDMVVLVIAGNDFDHDNSTERYALRPGYVPGRMPYGQAALDEDGNIRWFPPAIDFSDSVFAQASESRNSWHRRAIYRVADASYFMRWLGIKAKLISANDWVYRWFRPSEDSVRRYREWTRLMEERGVMFDEWAFTSWGLDQFKRRADHDGAALAILVTFDVGGRWKREYEMLRYISESLEIPIVSQHDYILRQGGRIEDAHWHIDLHWTSEGHRWAAEAIWEHVRDEWHGQCPQVEPRQDVGVEWVAIGESPDEVEYEDAGMVFQNTFGLHHSFHTPDGEAQVQSFPEFDSAGYSAVYESVMSRRPTVRSGWDVHIYAEGLTYLKEPCGPQDADAFLYLHVLPVDESDLPRGIQSSSFENLDFFFELRGVEFAGICMVSVDLPEYDVAGIKTGQIADGTATWSVDYNFALPGIIDAVQKLQQSGRGPDIRSAFDVHIDDGRLLYVKESCNAEDRGTPFFLHVFPSDEDDLSAGRAESGFDNLGFELIDKGGMHDDECFAAVDLPQYEIASIRTGQVADDAETWSAYYNFGLLGIMDVVQELQQSGREPDIQSNFDVYIDDGQLIYVKDSCSIDDRELPFFLHLFPADENNLAEGREESGFNNLDFELMQRGGESDGLCFAVVDLPAYEIMSIRTGQWVRGEGEVWEARIEFKE